MTTRLGVFDSLALRNLELQRVASEFRRLMRSVPSDYISSVDGPNYARFLKMFAEEYARVRSMMDGVWSDVRWDQTRVEYLYQNLGHRIHDIDQQTSFLPEITYDSNYRSFLLAILFASLRGSTPESLGEAVEAATGYEGEILEFFRLIQPYVESSGPYDETYRNFFRFIVDVPASEINIQTITEGLEFVGQLIKPAHADFDIAVRILFNVEVESNAGCCTEVGPTGVMRAGLVTKSRLKEANEQFSDCVRNGRTMRGQVTGTYTLAASPLIGHPELDGYIEVEGQVIWTYPSTNFVDIDGVYTGLGDLQVGDIVEIVGFIFESPLTSDGFTIQTKIEDTAVCVRNRWRLEDHFYVSYRGCPINEAECVLVEEVEIDNATFDPFRYQFFTPHLPLAVPPDCDICYQPGGLGGPHTLIQVWDQATMTPLDVQFVDPYTGRVVLVNPAPVGTIIATYYYWKYPVVGLVSDTDGLYSDMNDACGVLTAVTDLPYEDDGAPGGMEYWWLDSGTGLPVFQLQPAFCQTPYEDIESSFRIHYSGFFYPHSSCADTMNLQSDRTDVPYRHRLDDYNVISSRGYDILQLEGTTPESVILTLIQDQQFLLGTVLVPFTQDFVNGINRIFENWQFIPSLSSFMTYAFHYLTSSSLKLTYGELEMVREYMQNLYTALIAFSYKTEEIDGCTRKPRTRVCWWYELVP